jgi:hypothetical protein
MMADSFEMTTNVLELIGKFQSVRAGMDGVGIALKKRIAERIIELLPSNMHWVNSTGALESSFFYDGQRVTSDLPYARRRELGFSGMTDVRGIFYAHDPGGFYMRDTLQQVTTDGSINSTFVELMTALTGGGGG